MQSLADTVRSFDRGRRRLSVAGATCVGSRYPANFDVLHIDPELPFLAVADGMGGGRGSTVAGATAMTTLVDQIRGIGAAAGPDELRTAVADTQDQVTRAGAELGELTGCTLTALLAGPTGRDAWIVQLGDSRAYRLRGGLLELLTVDHTTAWLGLVHGWYAADSAEAAAARYQLTRYVGHPEQPEPDLLRVSLLPGDVYCLCTDGITDQLDYHRLRRLLSRDADLDEIARQLTADTIAVGGADNATVALLRVTAQPPAHRARPPSPPSPSPPHPPRRSRADGRE
ncbi:PP2C family protein-serine/threonine phosphatase [Plantactinospora sp. GCM10030261]|uniref:PP2C family protein-serine/threonine phosphatase n=1 Tax=Plantactinospora sp. GCM10030261 TaxID=3273420 RepID=UPI0036145A0F